jgi:hypothetical protein
MNDLFSDTQNIEVHPAANCFRLMREDELADLVDEIKTNGQIDPITIGLIETSVLGNNIEVLVDGRNRLRACKILGFAPFYERRQFENDDEVRAFVRSRSARRDLTKGERAAALALLFPDAPMGRGADDPAIKSAVSADISMRRVQEARQVGRYSVELLEAVRDGYRKLDEALEEVKAAREALQSEESKMTKLQNEAPDLADLVGDDRIKLDEAIAALEQRKAEAAKEEAAKRDTIIRVASAAYTNILALGVPSFMDGVNDRLGDQTFRDELLKYMRIEAEQFSSIKDGAKALAKLVASLKE